MVFPEPVSPRNTRHSFRAISAMIRSLCWKTGNCFRCFSSCVVVAMSLIRPGLPTGLTSGEFLIVVNFPFNDDPLVFATEFLNFFLCFRLSSSGLYTPFWKPLNLDTTPFVDPSRFTVYFESIAALKGRHEFNLWMSPCRHGLIKASCQYEVDSLENRIPTSTRQEHFNFL